jgi:hypothetical protein
MMALPAFSPLRTAFKGGITLIAAPAVETRAAPACSTQCTVGFFAKR